MSPFPSCLGQVAAREGIPVVLQPPNINDLEKWEGLFVTSTSRLMLCADRVVVEGQAEPKVNACFCLMLAVSAVPVLWQ